MTARVIGLDLSLTATGIASMTGARVFKPKSVGMQRLCDVRSDIALTLCVGGPLVVIEGYSYGSKFSHAHALGELGGVIRHYLHVNGIPYVDCPPKLLKKFATDNGNAAKVAMGMAASKAGYEGPADDNAVDAWWLYQFGLYAMDEGDLARTKYRDEAIGKIEWPELDA